MSTRVQKGSTVFRPIAKPRARPGLESRQASVAPDATVAPSPNATLVQGTGSQRAMSSMPPPSAIPSGKALSAPTEATEPAPDVTASSSQLLTLGYVPTQLEDMSTQTQSSQSSSRDVFRPPVIRSGTCGPTSVPVIVSSNSGNAIRVPSRDAPAFVPPPGSHRHTTTPVVASSPAPTPLPIAMASARPGPDVDHNANHSSHDDYSHSSPAFDMSQIDPMLMQPSQGHGNDLQSLVHAVSVFESEHSTLTPDEERAPHSSHTLEETTDVVNGEGAEGSNTHMTRKRKAKSADQPSDTNMSQEGSEARSRKRRSKKQPATDEPTGPGDEEHFVEAGSRRGASAVPRRSRTRQPSLPPFDPEADPGVELDPTATTMAALCNDTGHGRVSSKAAQIINNHAAWRATNREKRARMKAAMEAKKYGRNPDDDESAPPATIAEVPQDNLEVDITSAAHDLSGSTPRSAPQPSSTDLLGGEGARDAGDDFDYTQNLATSRFNVQVRIGPNGETIIDEESLFVDRNEEQDTTNYTHVEESDTTKFVNSGTYSKKLRGSRWSAEETELFYDALSQFGENYELISYVLPGRDRKACKNKFKAEDKKNSARITYCLTHRRPYDMETLSRMTGKDFSGPTPEIRAPTPLRSIELDTNRQEPNIEAKRAVRKSKTSRLDDDVEVLGDLEDIEKMDVDDAAFEN